MDKASLYKIGWITGAVGYAFPLAVGTGWYLKLVLPMLTGHAPYGALVHIGMANLVMTGLSGIVLCTAGLRRKIRPFWYIHLFFLTFVVTNDLYAALRAGWYPMPVVPGTLGTICLILTASCLKRPQE